MEIIKALNLGLRFILELCLLAAMGYVGYKIPTALPVKLLLAIGLPAVTATIWAFFIAPKAPHLLTMPYRLLLELLLFGVACGLLAYYHQLQLALIFAAFILVNEILLFLWKQ